MHSLLAWLRTHRLLTLLLALAVVLGGVHFFLEWRSEQRWQQYAEEARARGVKLTLVEFARPEIPDAENFAAIPMLRAAFAADGSGKGPLELPRTAGAMPTFGDRVKGERMDWVAWQTYFRTAGLLTETTDSPPRDVLRALETYAPRIAEWREWKTRPRSQFPLELEKGAAMPLPHLGVPLAASKFFGLRMRAHLAAGDSAAAYEDFQDCLQTHRALLEEPTLICGLVRVAVLAVLCSRAGEGLAEKAWAEPELARMEADLRAIRLWDDYRLAISSERGFSNATNAQLADASPMQRVQMVSAFGGMGSGQLPAIAVALIPKRVFRDNQLRQNQHFDGLLSRIDVAGARLDWRRDPPTSPERLTGAFERFYYFLFRISAPIYSTIEQRYLTTQTLVQHTRLAIALERCRRERGSFPEALSELAPAFLWELPVDAYSAESLRFRRTPEGSYALYSAGRDLRDDGGILDPKKNEKQQRDALWLYAPPAP